MLRTYKAQEVEWNYNIEGEFCHLCYDGFFPASWGTELFLKVFYDFQVTYIMFHFWILLISGQIS